MVAEKDNKELMEALGEVLHKKTLEMWEEKSYEIQTIAAENAKTVTLETLKQVLAMERELREKDRERTLKDFHALIQQASLLKTENLKLMKETERSIKRLFATGEFTENLRKYFMRLISEELGFRFSDVGMQQHIQKQIEEELKVHLDKHIRAVVSGIVDTTNNRLRKEYELTKKLTYSIDAEIRHLTMELPISAIDEQRMRDEITKALNNFKELQEQVQPLRIEGGKQDEEI